MNILIVENDNFQRNYLKTLIEKNFLEIQVYTAAYYKEGLSIIDESNKNIDLFFLNTCFPDGNGLELAKYIRSFPYYKLTGMIFFTSKPECMLKAFKTTHCYDILLKPYSNDAILNLIKNFITINPKGEDLCSNSIFIDIARDCSVNILIKNILFIEFKKNVCRIHTYKGIYNYKNISFKRLIEKINSPYIIQSHKSYAINIKHVESFKKLYTKLYEIKFIDYNESALIGYKYKKDILQHLA
ncbi:LytTR family DNA-binding domain-containing protein [Clostridium sp.]|uniref:LytR/AlgR family response regulator transcription factor n=1 Tax=Clostridium sp. TaxID=1506 RepID=UPI00321671E6